MREGTIGWMHAGSFLPRFRSRQALSLAAKTTKDDDEQQVLVGSLWLERVFRDASDRRNSCIRTCSSVSEHSWRLAPQQLGDKDSHHVASSIPVYHDLSPLSETLNLVLHFTHPRA